MKDKIQILLLLLALTWVSCSEEELSSESVITIDQEDYTPFDYWLERNYVAPYNIQFKYRYEDNESYYSRGLCRTRSAGGCGRSWDRPRSVRSNHWVG